MKSIFISGLSNIIALLIIPLWTVAAKKVDAKSVSADIKISDSQPKAKFYDKFKLLIDDTGEIKEIDATEYIIGVVAAEMPALYDEEALKAQAVAAYTFACYRRDTSNNNYDLTTNFSTDQAYCSIQQMKEKWGENYEAYYSKIKNVVSAVEGQLVCHNGKTALTVYHAISPGKTNPSSDVWGKEIPYLTSVDSIGDKLNKDYVSTATFSNAEINEKLSASGTDFSDIVQTQTKYVRSVSFGGATFTGSELQKALNLRSAAFDIAKSGDNFTFTVFGYGHGVGMSQSGADYMAKQGSSYKEILYWYYPGCKIVEN